MPKAISPKAARSVTMPCGDCKNAPSRNGVAAMVTHFGRLASRCRMGAMLRVETCAPPSGENLPP